MRNHHQWTSSEEAALATLGFLGVTQVCFLLELPPAAVKTKASRMKVSLKRKSEINATELQPAVLERLRQRDPSLICPGCGRRLAVARLGSCGPCHKQALIDVHNEKLADVEAQRALWKARQQLTRSRKHLKAESGGEAASV